MSNYIFQLGRESILALAELVAILPNDCRLLPGPADVAVIESPQALLSQPLIEKLGGTIKIAEWSAGSIVESDEELVNQLVRTIQREPRRTFGINRFGPGWPVERQDALGLRVKRKLNELGLSVRFVSSQKMNLSSVSSTTQLGGKGHEFFLLKNQDHIICARVVAIQPWASWSHFDYDRPQRDPKRGMLPPKLARIMLNLSRLPKTTTILDPFCGVGTVLSEAVRLGYQNIVGTDRDPIAISETATNLAWLAKEQGGQTADIEIFPSPIEELRPKHRLGQVGGVVSEIDLGPANLPTLNSRRQRELLQNLRPLYQRWLGLLADLVETNGIIILAYPFLRNPILHLNFFENLTTLKLEVLPFFAESWQHHPLLKNQGSSMTLVYERPNQTIGRDIIRLRKK